MTPSAETFCPTSSPFQKVSCFNSYAKSETFSTHNNILFSFVSIVDTDELPFFGVSDCTDYIKGVKSTSLAASRQLPIPLSRPAKRQSVFAKAYIYTITRRLAQDMLCDWLLIGKEHIRKSGCDLSIYVFYRRPSVACLSLSCSR